MNAIVKHLIDKLALQAATLLAQWLGKYLPHILAEWKLKKERELAQKEALKEYAEKMKDEGMTKEERMKAYEDYTNAGRK